MKISYNVDTTSFGASAAIVFQLEMGYNRVDLYASVEIL
jgi:hypothetical protein